MKTIVANGRRSPSGNTINAWALTIQGKKRVYRFVINNAVIWVWINLFDPGVFLYSTCLAFLFHCNTSCLRRPVSTLLFASSMPHIGGRSSF